MTYGGGAVIPPPIRHSLPHFIPAKAGIPPTARPTATRQR